MDDKDFFNKLVSIEISLGTQKDYLAHTYSEFDKKIDDIKIETSSIYGKLEKMLAVNNETEKRVIVLEEQFKNCYKRKDGIDESIKCLKSVINKMKIQFAYFCGGMCVVYFFISNSKGFINKLFQ